MTDHRHCLNAVSYSLVDDAVQLFQHLQAALAVGYARRGFDGPAKDELQERGVGGAVARTFPAVGGYFPHPVTDEHPQPAVCLAGWDAAKEMEVICSQEHVVRGIKLQLGGASDYPRAAGEFAEITGASDVRYGLQPHED